jgi:YegS/Rv2252/BmrU family lipid kinase
MGVTADDRWLILANRMAGSRSAGEPPLAVFAREAGVDAEIVYTRGPAHLRRVLRDRVLGKRDRVAVAGGDGTLHLAAQLLAGTGIALGILPQGTANNFATALRLPGDMPSAFRVLREGHTRRVDLGLAGREYFTEAAGVGLFSDLLAMTGGEHRLSAVLRGIAVMLRVIVFNRPWRMTLVIDGERQVEDVLSVTVANSFLVGYNIPIAPDAKVADARLDVVIIGSLTRREMFAYWAAIRRQEHLGLPKVQVVRAREVELRSRHAVSVHVDDRVRLRTPTTIKVAPGALTVMVDRSGAAAPGADARPDAAPPSR